MDAEGSSSRGFIAWHMGDYEDTSQRNSKRAVLLRQSKAALPIGSRQPKPPKLPKLPKKEEVRILMEREMATHSSTLAWRMDRGSLVGYSPQDRKELATTVRLTFTFHFHRSLAFLSHPGKG